MNSLEALAYLGTLGEDAGQDYDDIQDGYFGWDVDHDELTITFQPYATAESMTGTQTWVFELRQRS